MKARLLVPISDPSGATDEVIPPGTIVKVVELCVEGADNVCFPLEPDQAEVLLPTFEDLGFEIRGTDPGCLAYVLNLASGKMILVTDADGAWIPDVDSDQPALIGIYNENGESESMKAYPSCTAAVLALRSDLELVPCKA